MRTLLKIGAFLLDSSAFIWLVLVIPVTRILRLLFMVWLMIASSAGDKYAAQSLMALRQKPRQRTQPVELDPDYNIEMDILRLRQNFTIAQRVLDRAELEQYVSDADVYAMFDAMDTNGVINYRLGQNERQH